MADIKKVIKGLEYCIKSEDCRGCIYWEEIGLHEGCPLNSDALELLKGQEDEKKRIMKVIWDTLHEGLSIDTVADQDWVYEQIRHRIEDT